jgi:hypothetical protein
MIQYGQCLESGLLMHEICILCSHMVYGLPAILMVDCFVGQAHNPYK